MKITVIVPVYNAVSYLPACLDSLYAQTFADFELLLVDDGSTDGSQALCDSAARFDSRVKVFHKPNAGVSSARNLGLGQMTGDYVTFVDADDWVAPDMLERLYALASMQPDSLAACGNACVDAQGNPLSQTADSGVRLLTVREALMLQHTGDTPMRGNLCKLYPARLFRQGLRFDEDIHVGEDMLLIFRALLRLSGAVYDGAPRYYVRVHSGSVTGAMFNKKRLTVFETLSRMLAEAPDYPELRRALRTDYTRQAVELTATVYRHPQYLSEDVKKALAAAISLYKSDFDADTGVSAREKLRRRLWAACPSLVARLMNLRSN